MMFYWIWKDKAMKTNSFSGVNFLIVGLVLFLVGLLMILHQAAVVGFFSQILPDVQAIEISGVIVQFIGQILVIFGVIRLVSTKFYVGIQTERQALMVGFTQTMQRIDRIDRLISAQMSTTRIEIPTAPSNCKFCGTKIQQGRFCPKCNKSQN
jgi:hypothetical protein